MLTIRIVFLGENDGITSFMIINMARSFPQIDTSDFQKPIAILPASTATVHMHYLKVSLSVSILAAIGRQIADKYHPANTVLGEPAEFI